MCYYFVRLKNDENSMRNKDGRLRLLTHNGKTQSLTAWAKELGLRVDTLWRRLGRMSHSQALTQPPREAQTITWQGKKRTIQQWATLLCIKEDTLRKRLSFYGLPLEEAMLPGSRRVTHGHSKKPGFNRQLYRKWTSMRSRCRDHPNYIKVKICEGWRKFEGFAEDMGASYLATGAKKGKVFLDRIDNEKGYSKENCRWVNATQSAENRKSTRWLTFKGETLTMTSWARKLGLTTSALWTRLNKDPSLAKALTEPIRKQARYAGPTMEGV